MPEGREFSGVESLQGSEYDKPLVDGDQDTQNSAESPSALEAFLSGLLEPGSSLNPTFLLIVDLVLALLLGTFLTLAIITRGNIHVLVLMAIELGLWASIKWFVSDSLIRENCCSDCYLHRFVYELQKLPPETSNEPEEDKKTQ